MFEADQAFGAFHDAGSHVGSLSRLSALYLARKDFLTSFMFADRRCRLTPGPKARDFLLRAEALQGLGETDAAARDVARAYAIDPTDSLVARRVLTSETMEDRHAAARQIVASPRHDLPSLRAATELLLHEGAAAVGAFYLESGMLRGWMAWRGTDGLVLHVAGVEGELVAEIPLHRDATHNLAAGPTKACAIAVALPRGLTPHLSVKRQMHDVDGVLLALRINPAAPPEVAVSPTSTGSEEGLPQRCTIVVPVFDDLDATLDCLLLLSRQTHPTVALDVVLVNDNPGHAAIGELLEEFSRQFGFVLIRNPRNLGFIGSVNAALATIRGGDVLLLNSDVLMPAGVLQRLVESAYAAPDVGTVTPLSNNGELTSLPLPFMPSPLGSLEEIAALDGIAARVNAGLSITLPNGVGFCLYIKRRCLDAVGRLAESYLRGYLEDVDFCLRAKRMGFRNVCAANIYVGHGGTRSFKREKRQLVVRNLRVLQSRFPDYHAESTAFLVADPLRAARAAIERASQAMPLAPDPVAAAVPRPLLRQSGGTRQHRAPCRLGVVNATPSIATHRLLLALGRHLSIAGSPVQILVLGASLDDLRLMAAGNAFVTGPIAEDECDGLLRLYDVGLLFAPCRQTGRAELDRLNWPIELPVAYFDLSFGQTPGRPDDLSLDPGASQDITVGALAHWCGAMLQAAEPS